MATVLVVDDEPQITRSMKRQLESHGHTVMTASDGHAALAMSSIAAFEKPYDVICVDVHMPLMSGYDFIRAVRQLQGFDRTAYVITSGGVDDLPEDLCDIVDLVLDKPFEMERLLTLIKKRERVTTPPDP